MNKLLLTLLAIFLIIEEWLWDFLNALGHVLAKLLFLQEFERWLSRTSPLVALVAVSIPLLIVTPINLAAFFLLAHGLILQGILLEIVAKLLGTLLVARIFALTKPQLLTFKIIALIYSTVTGWLRWAHEKIAGTTLYRAAKAFKVAAKVRIKAWLGR